MNDISITCDNIEDFRASLQIRDGDLPFGIWDVFDRSAFESSPTARIVSIERIVSTRDERDDPDYASGAKPDPRQTAFEKMKQAANGLLARRAPIDVREKEDGLLYVADGNATVQVLMLAGWRELPVDIAE